MASGARAAARDPELADIVRRQQDVQKQASALRSLLATALSVPTDQQNAKAIGSLRHNIEQLSAANRALSEEIADRFLDYADLVNPKPATLEQARLALYQGESLIATYIGEDRTYLWAVPHKGDVTFAAVDMGAEELKKLVAVLRGSLDPSAATLGDIPDYDVELAYGLYKSLLKPIESGWQKSRSLLVVADGPLGYLLLSVLPTKPVKLGSEKEPIFSRYKDVAWLPRTHAITVVPSVASLVTLRRLPPGDPARRPFAGFGDPYFSPEQAVAAAQERAQAAVKSRGINIRSLPLRLRARPDTRRFNSAEIARLPRLPDTADEIRGIAVALKADLNEDVFLGARASEQRVKSLDLSNRQVIAFATHGLVPGDLNGLIEPALALSSPKVTGGDNDGLLTLGEILALKLDADWVVLSACNTAAAQGAGAEAVSGLGRAFFYAGTRALLVSNWPVETTSAKVLTTDLFRRQSEDRGLSRAEALRQAMLGLMDGPGYIDPDTDKVVFSYAHPIFWAPFTIVGDGGGRPAV